jgi:two-component system, chemotaxis family, chemotaxis protein CheY
MDPMDKTYKVLIADDSAFARKVIMSYLVGTEFQVVASADNGKTALEHFRASAPDIVLLDVIMPDMSGAEVLRVIMTEQPTARVLMVSSLGTEGMVTGCLAIGAKAFIQKPTDKATLLATLQKLVSGGKDA